VIFSEAVKRRILPGLEPLFDPVASAEGSQTQIQAPDLACVRQCQKKRNAPSLRRSICSNIRRHPAGEKNDNTPTNRSIRASAGQKVVPFRDVYFFAGAVALPPEPRMALKKSDD
jgi:hypothetical protein